MDDPASVVVRGRSRVFDGFFKLDEVTVSHRRLDGSMSPDKPYLVFERGDSVGALILNRDTGQVVLVDQFRAPTLGKSARQGWMLEAVAGKVEESDTPEQTIVREAFEETGYRISNPEHIATFFSSPGSSSERIFMFYAEVTNADRTGSGGGVVAEGEDIRIVSLDPAALIERVQRAEIDDPKLIIAAYHLKDRLRIGPPRPKVLEPDTIRFALKSNPALKIGIKTGEILKVRNVDAWVNCENTDMMMDRIIGKSISANIRYGGAHKDAKGAVLVDTIALDLRRKLAGRPYVNPGAVIETEAGELSSTHGVARIVHVATVDAAGPGKGVKADLETIADCLARVLAHEHKRNSGWKWKQLVFGVDNSILIPLMGAGEGGLTAAQVAPRLVDGALRFFAENPTTALHEIFLLAYMQPDKDACMKALLARPELEAA
jgi:nudix-type nucleoside diphosphatase (YffH/AdpP family)